MRSVVLCYNLKGTAKGRKLAMIFGFLGYKIRHVEAEEYKIPLKALVEGGEQTEKELYTGKGFTEEMLIMQAATEDLLDKALFLMHKEKVRVELKAVITPNNQEWDSLSLYREIKKEHEYMKQQEERKQ